jgi:hypothetical protein
MRHARSPLTDVRPRTSGATALKVRAAAAEENLVDVHARTTGGRC